MFNMAKISTYPTLYHEMLQLNISVFKYNGFLNPEQMKSGVLNWSTGNRPTGKASVTVSTLNGQPYIELSYSFNNTPINYKIWLTSTPSNLNNGKIWYFLCPVTNKRSRILYLADGAFLNREALKNCMYEKQAYSRKQRRFDILCNSITKPDELYEQVNKKYFKKTYAGKPTKKYLRIMEQIQKAESIPYHEIKRAMFS